MPSAGFLIYSGVMPLIKTFLGIFAGYFLARRGVFPKAASQGASQITMNVSLPALIFANIVPAFTPQNISALGPLFLLGFAYQGIGLVFGAVIREFCYVPRNFWQGIIIMTAMSNWGNLPNAVVLSVTQQSPFDPTTDPALGVSFVSIFIVSYNLLFWVFGGAHSLSWDYLPGVPQGEEAERHVSWREKPIGSLVAKYILRQRAKRSTPVAKPETGELEKGKDTIAEDSTSCPTILQYKEPIAAFETSPDLSLARHQTHVSHISQHPATTPSGAVSVQRQTSTSPSAIPPVLPHHSLLYRILHPIKAVFHPVTIALLISLPIALVNPLKALFVDVTKLGGPDFKGPDGRPPLAFIIDTANFLGNIAVPLALILLGASFARLQIPRPISRLPIMAMLAVSVAKMAIMPVIGVLTVQSMVKGGLIDRDARAEKFVAMFLSGTPAAVNQLIVSSLYAPDGNVDTLSAFLLVQYIFMFFSSSALTAVALLLS
ncbi:auxin efflux carrier [Cristinia sonorae]|uniref:Auxin efflux carrier n=1 Tax=Cristinia sonorae TaxID=1940300 RepID=A0A8K0UHN3_9AGAR|nr:auxin efflux carrier [Cristinia sonorae]